MIVEVKVDPQIAPAGLCCRPNRPAALLFPTLTLLLVGLAAPASDLAVKPPQASNYVVRVSWSGVRGAVGYRAYFGPAIGTTTNRLELGTNTTARLVLPLSPRNHIVVRAYNAYGVESTNSNTLQYPADVVVDVSGTQLQMSPAVSPPTWVNTNSPWRATNTTGTAFFRSQDPTGPTITQRLVYASQVATYYVATNGSRTNSGLSTKAAWPLTYALTQAPAGSTVLVLPGTYAGDCEIDKPLTLRSQVKWGARLINLPYGLQLGYSSNASGTLLDGFEVAYSSYEGVHIVSSNCTIRNCWVHDAGIYRRPKSHIQANSGIQGVANGTTVEYCLSENNGSTPGYDHGIYLAGTNLTIRGNVVRGNWGFGMQFYDQGGVGVSAKVYDNLVYGNGAQTINNWDGIWQVPRGSNTLALWNNTILATHGPPIQGGGAFLCLTNNILLGPSGAVISVGSQTVWADYNLSTVSLTPYAGAHDVVSAATNFVNPSTGLYWLLAASPACGKANPGILPPMDFWGHPQASVADIGAFQYSPIYATDTRTLDPSTTNGADYWAPLSTPLPAPVLRFVSEK
jgi:hypothetical protein